MIKIITKDNCCNILPFLSEDHSINTFIIGYLKKLEEDNITLWCSINKDNHIDGVLLKFNNNYIPYYKDSSFDTKIFKEII